MKYFSHMFISNVYIASLNDLYKSGNLTNWIESFLAILYMPLYTKTSLVAQMIKHLPIMRETWVQSLGREDLLEKKMVTHSSTLAWKISWMEEPGRLQSMGSQRVRQDWVASLHFTLYTKYIKVLLQLFQVFS